jgi:hypothetical protein
MYWLSSVICSYFILDVFATFFTAYEFLPDPDEPPALITDMKQISLRYVKSWLLPDLVASFPLDWMQFAEGISQLRLLRFVRLLRIARVLRLVKFTSLLSFFDPIIEAHQMLGFLVGVVKILGLILFATHWCACFGMLLAI